MNTESVKIQGEGYLLNGNMHVPKADGNSEYEAIKQWLSEGNTPEPEFTQAELDAIALGKLKSEARQYLASTDWYITRFAETGVVVPEDVTAKRAEARAML